MWHESTFSNWIWRLLKSPDRIETYAKMEYAKNIPDAYGWRQPTPTEFIFLWPPNSVKTEINGNENKR